MSSAIRECDPTAIQIKKEGDLGRERKGVDQMTGELFCVVKKRK